MMISSNPLQVDRVLHRGHRIGVADDPLHLAAGGLAQLRQRLVEDLLGLVGTLVLGVHHLVQPVCPVRNEQREGARSPLGTLADRVQQRAGGSGLVGDDEHPRGL